MDRRSALTILSGAMAAGLAGCGPRKEPAPGKGDAPAPTTTLIRFATDWRAQAEHGGFYQALATGEFAKRGLDVEIRQGGPSLNIGQLLLTGRVDMIMSNSFEAFTYVREGAPFFTIASTAPGG